MTYEESAALMTDFEFRGRVKVSSLKYADSIMGRTEPQPFHNTLLRWAQNTFANPDVVAAQIQSPVVMDAAVQAAGKDITDEALQASVETVVNKSL